MKKALKILGAAFAAASLMLAVGVTPANADETTPHKSYVCKYVGTPGVNETLQTGQNPIWVDNHSLLGVDGETYVGQEFSDQHGRSVVIVANTEKLDPEPTLADCPIPEGPSPSPSPLVTPSPSVTPSPPKDELRQCRGNGVDRPKCQLPVPEKSVPGRPTLAFTGSNAAGLLSLAALFMLVLGLWLIRAGKKRA